MGYPIEYLLESALQGTSNTTAPVAAETNHADNNDGQDSHLQGHRPFAIIVGRRRIIVVRDDGGRLNSLLLSGRVHCACGMGLG